MSETELPACLTLDFEGKPLHTYTWRGTPVWVALEISDRLGYTDGRLVFTITREWNSEFAEGRDYMRLVGKELRAFKAETGLATDSVGSRAPHLILLTEPGLYLTLIKTHQPAGVRLRRFIADEVLPRLVRGGAREVVDEAEVPPEREGEAPEGEEPMDEGEAPTPGCVFVGIVVAMRRPGLAELREMRLLERERRLMRVVDLADRRFKVAELRKSAKRLVKGGFLDEVGAAAVEVMAVEVATGVRGVVAL